MDNKTFKPYLASKKGMLNILSEILKKVIGFSPW